MRILLAEDERSLARAIVKIFEKNGYSADAVHNGEDALMYLDKKARKDKCQTSHLRV